MALKGPKGAIPTIRGWIHPRTGELLKSQRISEQQIQDWHGAPEPVLQTLHEAPVVEVAIDYELEQMFYGHEEEQ